MTDKAEDQMQSRDVENLLTCSFNSKCGVADRLLNKAHNAWLNSFITGGLASEFAYRDAITACMQGMSRTHGSIKGYIDAKNEELRGLAEQNGLDGKKFEVDFDGLATAKVRNLDKVVNMKQKPSREEREHFTTLFLERYPVAVESARASIAQAVESRQEKAKQATNETADIESTLNRIANMAA